MRKSRFSYATLVGETDADLPSTQMYTADDLVSTSLDTETEGSSRQPSMRNSTSTRVSERFNGKHHYLDDGWSEITTLERRHESLDADLSIVRNQSAPADYVDNGHEDSDNNDQNGGLRVETRARRLRRKARRRLSEAMEKARNGWTLIFLAL
ncbi:hypothetical protein FB639_001078, partial [Coemansia asiatica]